MTHAEVVNALAHGWPGVEFNYDGDGSTLGPVEVDGELFFYGLQWHGDTAPPTMAEVVAVHSELTKE